MTKLRQPCPVPACNGAVGTGNLMCGPCWGAVPPDLQKRVHRTFRAWMRSMGDADLMRAYKDAAAVAIEAV